jgi:hypothetical protein
LINIHSLEREELVMLRILLYIVILRGVFSNEDEVVFPRMAVFAAIAVSIMEHHSLLKRLYLMDALAKNGSV